MTSCCRSRACEQMFTERAARKDLARYQKRGLDRLERRMVDSAAARGLAGARVLEIGGGIGKLQVELLDAGAATGEVAELVGAYEPYAEELADLLEQPDAVEPGDVVVLNRVVCCSPDGIELAAAAARLARRTLILSYPRDVAWVRLGVRAINLVQRVLGRSFRVFVHPPSALRAAAEAEGLARSETARGSLWEFTTLVRSAERGAL